MHQYICYTFEKANGGRAQYCIRVGPKHCNLRIGNWNITSLNGKEQELVWEAKQYHPDILKVFCTKRRGSDTLELNKSRKFST